MFLWEKEPGQGKIMPIEHQVAQRWASPVNQKSDFTCKDEECVINKLLVECLSDTHGVRSFACIIQKLLNHPAVSVITITILYIGVSQPFWHQGPILKLSDFFFKQNCFMEDNFSTDGEGRGWFPDDLRAWHLLCTSYFYYYYISSTSDHQALDPGLLGDPWCRWHSC